MTVLVITHTESEDPGHVAPWLAETGLELSVLEPWRGDVLPDSLDGYQALVVMGGPQQAYDDSSAPWLRTTKDLLRLAVTTGLPTFGVCLGGQLLAEATGGVVEVSMQGPELGARLVAKRDAASADPLFWDLPLSPMVIQWHWDEVVELPQGATLLMSSTNYPHQAFRVGECAWGLQFHIEADAEMLSRWADHNAAELAADGIDARAIVAGAVPELEEIQEVWGEVVRRFGRLVIDRAGTSSR